jgi:hypothetical protein
VAYDRGVPEPIATCLKDGVVWPAGTQAQVDWITEGADGGRWITAAIPPRFADYATLINGDAGPGLPRDLSCERRQDLAGPDQAATWRPAPGGEPNWKSTELPEVMFPDDRSWLVSFLWDDDWACIGGSTALINDVLSDPVLAPNAHRVDTQQDATPPGDWPG